MKEEKVILQGYYNLGGSYLLFEDNPLHGKTYHKVDVSFSKEVRTIAGMSYEVDVICIEGCEPIECELVGSRRTVDGTLLISICQDWG